MKKKLKDKTHQQKQRIWIQLKNSSVTKIPLEAPINPQLLTIHKEFKFNLKILEDELIQKKTKQREKITEIHTLKIRNKKSSLNGKNSWVKFMTK